MIREYMVITGENAIHLQEQVHKQIEQGWQPLGGIAVATFGKDNEYITLYQAMGRANSTGLFAYGGVQPVLMQVEQTA